MVKCISKGGFDDNFTWLLSAPNGDLAIIDPCGNCCDNLPNFADNLENVRYILITHGHSDHFDALEKIKSLCPNAKAAGFYQAEFPRDILLRDGDTLPFGNDGISVLHTPGHSRDSVCYRYQNALFTGDTVFIGCIGFCRSPKTMADSLEKILALPDELVIYSGHDYGNTPFRSLKQERLLNPELSKEFIASLRNG